MLHICIIVYNMICIFIVKIFIFKIFIFNIFIFNICIFNIFIFNILIFNTFISIYLCSIYSPSIYLSIYNIFIYNIFTCQIIIYHTHMYIWAQSPDRHPQWYGPPTPPPSTFHLYGQKRVPHGLPLIGCLSATYLLAIDYILKAYLCINRSSYIYILYAS